MLGFSNLVADGISMGFGDFVSSSTEKDVAAKERVVTAWDVTNHGGNEKEELLRQYQALGMDINDATMVWPLLHSTGSKYLNIALIVTKNVKLNFFQSSRLSLNI